MTSEFVILFLGFALECYVCDRQDGNAAKCLKTIQTCEPEQTRCLSEIRWSTEPYWSQVQFDQMVQELNVFLVGLRNICLYTMCCVYQL